MDGRVTVGLITLAAPAVLLGATVWKFGSNPLSMVALLAVMVLGSFYLLSYTESF
ncbi:MAG TPA: hypothetical protein VIZ68_01180 [Thermoplasmata archaeon]